MVGGAETSSAGSKWFLGAVMAVALAFGGYMLLGMPGMDHTATNTTDHSSMAGMVSTTVHRSAMLGPSDFAGALDTKDAFLLNVHIPYDGELEGTDAFIPFNLISTATALPRDKDTEILVYCRTGRMSKEASAALLSLGYANVTELEGGMDAWRASGRQIVERPS